MNINRQSIYDAAVKGLASQAFARSKGPNKSCRYRGERGRKCAIGHLIPDENYNSFIEGMSAKDTQVMKCLGLTHLEGMDGDFMVDLQNTHDNVTNPRMMINALIKFADDWGLVYSKELVKHLS